MMDYIVDILGILAWPVIILIALITFRKEISGLLSRLRLVDLSKKVLAFGEAYTDQRPHDKPEPKPKLIKEENSIKKTYVREKPATLFWLANDLMWLQDMLYRNGPRESIIEGLRNVIVYSEELGFSTSFVIDELQNIVDEIELDPKYPPIPLLVPHRNVLATRIEKVKWSVASRIEVDQPSFEKLRVFIK